MSKSLRLPITKPVLRRLVYTLVACLLVLGVSYFDLIIYGIGQGYGQFKILWNARPIAKVLADTQVPDSVKAKVRLVQEIKRFAIDSLGIKPSDNYEHLYDTQGKPVLWVVTAAQPYALEAKTWNYGFLGDMSYRGFFEEQKARSYAHKLQEQGYDTYVGTVAAWSTLGWFKDPILSHMLDWPEGALAALIIHELTHGTLWVKDSVDYNENLADFVGDQGALRFLQVKYGAASPQVHQYEASKRDQERYDQHWLGAANQLDSLYKSFGPNTPEWLKAQRKQAFLQKIVTTLDTVSFEYPAYYRGRFRNSLPNNTYLMTYLTYRGQQNVFEQEWRERFHQNFQAYLSYLKQKYHK
ncbi:aminopeptidase [Eisenibacter elegans]|uniref:aminopeptidase n=1 Tax=Eisenibacter elegans TaxID=997 RepID=UPI0003F97D77|nr:aminopeptidase [Eisenibacter elegans]